jgi:hypothetical protein
MFIIVLLLASNDMLIFKAQTQTSKIEKGNTEFNEAKFKGMHRLLRREYCEQNSD